MGNNPVIGVDPSGGYSKFGAWWRAMITPGVSTDDIFQSGDQYGFWKGDTPENQIFMVGKYGEGKATLTEWKLNFWQSWSMKEGFLADYSYEIADNFYVTTHFFAPSREKDHLDGQPVLGWDGADAFVGTTSTLLPQPKMNAVPVPKINAAQFSSIFKGNLAKLKPWMRGKIIIAYNESTIKAHNYAMKLMSLFKLTENNSEVSETEVNDEKME
jgi:hypothetical protein